MVHEKIKKVWVDQGIWNNEWKEMAVGHWKHEEPLVLESGLGTDLKAESPPGLFDMAPKQPQQRPRRPKSDDEKRRIAERRVVLEREREASRPYHQFVYQISKERERIEHESRSAEGSNNADINTKAYENVKNTWVKRGIWKTKWGILPGMSWKHEEPIEQVIEDSLMPEIPPRNPQSPRGKAVKAPFKLSFIRPLLFEPTHLQESGIRDASQHDSSKISRATGKERLRPRPRPYIPEQVSASVPQASSEGNAAERQPPPVHVTLRRSERLRRPVSSVTEDPQETVFPNPSKRAARPKPELKAVKNTTARRSEKPQGVTKRLQAKTGWGKAKNK
ncbi:MAG: hypothetical protein FRX48_03352 [Lasallia pustulata]|uniref:Uncharacterized protein n=1 Tax=Lasallia pustulata TaxID=136370 RepID=A0A5M8PTM3_9LECA|nr:MAG: hypothetical protein FRX48_03352 [Lasallia pustulata]